MTSMIPACSYHWGFPDDLYEFLGVLFGSDPADWETLDRNNVWEIPNVGVLKKTCSRDELTNAKRLLAFPKKFLYTPHGVFKFGASNFILMPKYTPLSTREQCGLFDTLDNLECTHCIKKILASKPKNHRNRRKLKKYNIRQIVKDLQKLGRKHVDLHPGNIVLDKKAKRYRLIDLECTDRCLDDCCTF